MNFAKLAKAGKRCSRLGAVQVLYSMLLTSKEVSHDNIAQEVKRIIQQYREGVVSYPEPVERRPSDILMPKQAFTSHLLQLVAEFMPKIDNCLTAYLTAEWDLEKMGLLSASLLRIACAEMLYAKEVPTNVLLDEYVSIASYFSEDEQVGFINAVLQKLAQDQRANQP